MRSPEKAQGPEPKPEARTITTGNTTTSSDAAAFGVMTDRSPTTTRRCEGLLCWCHVGSNVAWPLTHDQELARMARAIRSLEIAEGALGL